MDTNVSNIHAAQMHSVVQDVCKRAAVNARRMGHAEVTPAHLMLGILALGNQDQTLPIPRILRNCRLHYEPLKEFLQATLPSQALADDFDPQLSAEAHYVLQRALNLSKASRRAEQSRGTIITSDLAKALVDGHDALLQQAFDALGVNRMIAHLALNERLPLEEKHSSLHLVG